MSLSSRGKKTNAINKKMEKHAFETMIIITSLTTKFIAAFHGPYLLAAQSYSFQLFLFSFRADQVEKSLKTMSNKRF